MEPSKRTRTAAVLAAGLALLSAAATAEPSRLERSAPPPTAERLSFRLEAEVASAALDAWVEAGGELRMERRAGPGGDLTLSLLQPLEHPWKLYAVDPAGPAGDEVKLAAEVLLPEVSWEALAVARREADRFGAEKHRSWSERSGARRPFNGAFAFLVIGPPDGRFRAEIGADGRLRAVVNRMTDRWLPGDFDRLVAAWRAPADGAGPPQGYWFWNRGEAEPPAWEPHAYDALAAALALLALPVFPQAGAEAAAARGEGGIYSLQLAEVAGRARRVLETLAPRTRGRLPGAGGAAARFRVEAVTPQRLVVAGEVAKARLGGGRDTSTLTFLRRTAYDRRRRQVEADRVRVGLQAPGARLTVEIGYRPERESAPPGGAL